MILNLGTFEKELKRVTLESTADVEKTVRYVMLRAIDRIVFSTPVDTGHARKNWQLGINRRPAGTVRGRDKSGGETAAKASALVAAANAFSDFYLVNNVEYIEVLEYGLFQPTDPGPSRDPRTDRHGKILVRGGFSTQAPAGMARVAFQALMKGFK